MRIPCPYCGLRDVVEFTFERPAEAVVPLGADLAETVLRLYTRTNPRGVSEELWRHQWGCRAFLRVTRDLASHAILDARALDEPGA